MNSIAKKDSTVLDNLVLKTIFQRKSVRHYLDKTIPEQDLITLVKAGSAAPSARDKRPWAFILINQKDSLMAMAEGLVYGKMLSQANAAIVVCGLPDKGFENETNDYWVHDCSAVTENILLAAESLSLGAVWLGIHPREDRIQSLRLLFKIPQNAVPFCVIALGHPQGIETSKDKFDPKTLHWNQW